MTKHVRAFAPRIKGGVGLLQVHRRYQKALGRDALGPHQARQLPPRPAVNEAEYTLKDGEVELRENAGVKPFASRDDDDALLERKFHVQLNNTLIIDKVAQDLGVVLDARMRRRNEGMGETAEHVLTDAFRKVLDRVAATLHGTDTLLNPVQLREIFSDVVDMSAVAMPN